jgi:hypothetical protein
MKANVSTNLMVWSENNLTLYSPKDFFQNLKTMHIDGEIVRYMSYGTDLRKIDSVVQFMDNVFENGSIYYCVIWDEKEEFDTREEYKEVRR